MDALVKNPWDVNLLVSLGVLKFVDWKYKEAEVYFMQAIWECPTDYSTWNKYGAAKANYWNTVEAIELYWTALEIRPNLVRTWANLGMAYSNMGQYSEAIGFYLNALSLNPNADHIWDYIKSASFHMWSKEFMEMAKHWDINLFWLHFNVIDPKNLPQPSYEKLFSHPLVNSRTI